MTSTAEPRDDPAAYVAEDRRRALAGGPGVDGHVRGATLFVDVSGFTAMTQALVVELGERRASEVLAATLDGVFGPLIGELHRWGGAVLYFSGDAITCWFSEDDGTLATRAALSLQEVMSQVGSLVTPGGTLLVLRAKMAVAAGTAHRFLAGDPAIQRIDVLAGALMDEVAATEGVAEPGDVLVTPSVAAVLPHDVQTEMRAASGPLTEVHVVRAWPDPGDPPDAGGPLPELSESITREWLLPPVYERLSAGRGELLADLRPAVPVFVRFGGIDPDGDPEAPGRLHAFVVAVQRVVDGYGGNVLQLTVGDKGAYLYAVFGSPIAHEDDAARACAAGLDIAALEVGGVVDIQVGIASGLLRSGTYGHPGRRTFCCLGDGVNLAARLMAKAASGTVLVSAAVASAAGDDLALGEEVTVQLKGRSEVSTAYVVRSRGEIGLGPLGGRVAPMVGRTAELARLVGAARAATEGDDSGPGLSVIGVTADIGAGKSLLLATAMQALRHEGLRVVGATAPSRGVVAAYAGWRPLWQELLDIEPTTDPAAVLDRLETVLPAALHPRLPLWTAVLGVPLPDNDLTATLEGELRKKILEQLVVSALAHLAAQRPLVLAIDDAHALDPLARDLLVEVVRRLDDLPACLLLGYREGEEPFLGLALDRGARAEELRLDHLEPGPTRDLTRRMLGALFGRPGTEDQVELVVARSEGNPLWVRELCRWLHDHAEEPGADQMLPDTLHGLVLGRIDRLEETPRRTAKVASVTGRRFSGTLVRRAWPDLGTEGDVRRALQHLAVRGITVADDLGSDRWRFSHGVLRDVALESLPLSVRQRVHDGVGQALETGEFGPVEGLLDALAHHAWNGSSEDRKRTWLWRAGESAQAAYAHETALLHYERLLTVLPLDQQPQVQVQVGKVHELRAQWEAAAAAYAAARAGALDAGDRRQAGWATTWSAEIARKQGRYDEAHDLLIDAIVLFDAVGEEAGIAQVGHFAGTLSATQGDLAEARTHYTRSLEVRERLGDRAGIGSLLSNLAIVAEYEGDYTLAAELGERALAVRRELGDRWAIGISQNNLGMLATLRGDPREAQERFAESMALHTEVGDAWMVALGHHNLGNAHRDLGEHDVARSEHALAFAAYRSFADDWALATLYEDAALLLGRLGRHEDAWRLVGASDALHEAIGSPRTPDVAARLERDLGAPVPQARIEGAALDATELGSLLGRDR